MLMVDEYPLLPLVRPVLVGIADELLLEQDEVTRKNMCLLSRAWNRFVWEMVRGRRKVVMALTAEGHKAIKEGRSGRLLHTLMSFGDTLCAKGNVYLLEALTGNERVCANLTSLVIEDTCANDTKALSLLRSLHSLTISGVALKTSMIAQLKDVSTLRTLTIDCENRSCGCPPRIWSSLTQLEALDLSLDAQSMDGRALFSVAPTLKRLKCHTRLLCIPYDQRQSMAHLTWLENIEDFHLEGTTMGRKQFRTLLGFLKHCRRLTAYGDQGYARENLICVWDALPDTIEYVAAAPESFRLEDMYSISRRFPFQKWPMDDSLASHFVIADDSPWITSLRSLSISFHRYYWMDNHDPWPYILQCVSLDTLFVDRWDQSAMAGTPMVPGGVAACTKLRALTFQDGFPNHCPVAEWKTSVQGACLLFFSSFFFFDLLFFLSLKSSYYHWNISS